MIGAANKDPDFFSNPEEFNIYRSTRGNKAFNTHSRNVSFGTGMHTCVEAPLDIDCPEIDLFEGVGKNTLILFSQNSLLLTE